MAALAAKPKGRGRYSRWQSEAAGRRQKRNEAAVDVFVCGRVLRRLRRGKRGHDAERLDVGRVDEFRLGQGPPVVRCRGVLAALVTSTAPADTCAGTLSPRGSQSAAVRQWTAGMVAEMRPCWARLTPISLS
ncbi:hypothetical protein ACSSS7_007385 [Eimeria intestinalis]